MGADGGREKKKKRELTAERRGGLERVAGNEKGFEETC